jgi:dihydrofolate reductase
MMEIVLVVAIAENGVIGKANTIPWRLKTDQQRLKAITMGKPIVMGRKTFESFRRPLPGRTNIVVTRDAGYQANGALVVTSSERAFEAARGDALRRFATEIMIIGGSGIYTEWMPRADRLEITEVHMEIDGDAVFKPDLSGWQEIARVRNKSGPDDSVDFSYVTLRRKPPN